MHGKHYKKRNFSGKAIIILIVIIAASIISAAIAYTYAVKNNPQVPGQSDTPTVPSEGGNTAENKHQPTAEEEADKLVSGMSLEEKIGQMVIIGFKGYDADANTASLIEDKHIGGIILFERNIENDKQLVDLNNQLKSLNKDNKLPLFISADHEGGRIARLPARATDFPSNLTIGKKNSSDLSYQVGQVLGSEMAAYGFNLDFAPVADIFSNPKNTVIGDRSFGKDPDTVSGLAVATMKGIKSQGVVPVVKHFPGHGDTAVDSHVDLPVSYKSMKQLKSFELLPFESAIDQGADMMMVAHIKLPEIDKTGLPASLSHAVITGLLRDDLGFKGVVITDDLEMGAIAKHYGTGDAAVKAVEAGADMVLVCHTYESQTEAIDAIAKAVKNGQISEERIDESVKHIVMLKQKYKLSDKPVNLSGVEETVGSEKHQSIADKARVK